MLLSSIHLKGNIAYNISREPESYQENTVDVLYAL